MLLLFCFFLRYVCLYRCGCDSRVLPIRENDDGYGEEMSGGRRVRYEYSRKCSSLRNSREEPFFMNLLTE